MPDRKTQPPPAVEPSASGLPVEPGEPAIPGEPETTQPIYTEEEHELDYDPHGWGDLKTWGFLSVLIFGFLITTVIIFFIVGKGRLTTWNLGWPPTAPNLIGPLLRLPGGPFGI